MSGAITNDLYEDDLQIETLNLNNNYEDCSFSAVIKDGVHIKNLMEHLKNSGPEGVWIFTRDEIRYVPGKTDTEPSIFNVLTMYTKELVSYSITPEDAHIEIGVSTEDIKIVTSIINKKDSVTICKDAGDNKLHFKISSGSGDSHSNVSHVMIKKVEKSEIAEPEFSSNRCNCTVPAEAFTKMCNSMGKIKSNQIEIKGYRSGVVIEAQSSRGLAGNSQKFGDVGPNEVPQSVYTVMSSTIKKLNKLGCITPKTLLKLYFDPKLPVVKISATISQVLGKLDVYLSDASKNI